MTSARIAPQEKTPGTSFKERSAAPTSTGLEIPCSALLTQNKSRNEIAALRFFGKCPLTVLKDRLVSIERRAGSDKSI
jgi:hypothetical protein